jgi:hypothetical protein
MKSVYVLVVLLVMGAAGISSALYVEWTMPEVMYSSSSKEPVYLVDYKGIKHPIPAEGLPSRYEKVWVK